MEVSCFKFTSGPANARVMLVGEAWGSEENRLKVPFVGASGNELSRILGEAGFNRNDMLLCNVVDVQPPDNDFEHLWNTPLLQQGLAKLDTLIATVKPDLIIGCGNIPLWALTSRAPQKKSPAGITSWRGSQLYTIPIAGKSYPFLPIVHPAAILRSWDLRHVTVHDLKARALPFIYSNRSWEAPSREMYFTADIKPQMAVLSYWLNRPLKEKLLLAVDIETWRRKHIACIGIADGMRAICFPFFYLDANGYVVDTLSAEQEAEVWIKLQRLLHQPNVEITGQNFIYDIQYLNRKQGFRCVPAFDTMLAHHLCWPGTPKSLSYLASLYCEHYIYWKDESQEWDTTLSHESMWQYNCKDVLYTHEITLALRELITKLNLKEQFACQLDQWELAASMMRRGVKINVEEKDRISRELFDKSNELEQFLMACVPADTAYTSTGGAWFNSPKATMDLLYRQLQLAPVLDKKTKRPTSSGEALDVLKKRAHWLKPMFEALDDLRSVAVFRSHFLEAKLFNDRMCSSFNVGGTETFRWSSSANGFEEGTNLQNIPKGSED